MNPSFPIIIGGTIKKMNPLAQTKLKQLDHCLANIRKWDIDFVPSPNQPELSEGGKLLLTRTYLVLMDDLFELKEGFDEANEIILKHFPLEERM